MTPVNDYMDYILEDDDTPFGGIDYPGETVEDFLLSLGSDGHISTVEQLNEMLVECGIKPIEV